jgi:hypothetical protein
VTVRVLGTNSCYWKGGGGSFCSLFRASTADQVVPRARTSSTNVHSDANLPT